MEPVRFVAYSDYLCPWCYNAAVRLERLERESGGAVQLEWRSYLLRPTAREGRDLERFRAYTRSWLRPAAEPDSGAFRIWEGDAGPPSHSVPAHLVAKAAARVGPEAFARMHACLLRAYFGENRDVSDRDTLRDLWRELALPVDAFDRMDDPELLREVLGQHQEALEIGVTGVPAIRREGDDAVIVGAHPLALYQRWVARLQERAAEQGAAR